MDVEKIIEKCLQKHSPSQHQLYLYLAPKIYGVCLKYASDKDEAKDNMQEIFIIIFNNLRQYEGKVKIDFWAKKIAINYNIRQFNEKKKIVFQNETDQLEDQIDEDTEEDFNYTQDELLQFIQELPDQYRIVFNLFVLDDYSHKAIAEMLNISENTSKSNLSRAKGILRKKLLHLKQENVSKQ